MSVHLASIPPLSRAPKSIHRSHPPPQGGARVALAVAALGVVFGDLGTSPLYTLQECMSGAHGAPPTDANVYRGGTRCDASSQASGELSPSVAGRYLRDSIRRGVTAARAQRRATPRSHTRRRVRRFGAEYARLLGTSLPCLPSASWSVRSRSSRYSFAAALGVRSRRSERRCRYSRPSSS